MAQPCKGQYPCQLIDIDELYQNGVPGEAKTALVAAAPDWNGISYRTGDHPVLTLKAS